MSHDNQPFGRPTDSGDGKLSEGPAEGPDAGDIYRDLFPLKVADASFQSSDKIFNEAFNSFANGDFKPFANLFNNPNFSVEQIQNRFDGVTISKDTDGIRLYINDKEHPSIQRILKIGPDGKISPEVKGDTQSLDYVDFQRKLPKLPDGRRVDFTNWERPFINALKRRT